MWYVFDEVDCFDRFESAQHAASCADKLLHDLCKGVHMAYMSVEQFDSYCQTGAWPFSAGPVGPQTKKK